MQIQSAMFSNPSTVVEQFYSKRNTVRFLRCSGAENRGLVVLKEHRTLKGAVMEYDTLTQLSGAGINVPLPLGRDGTLLYLQYLDGELLVDILEHNLVSDTVWTAALARWYRQLHAVTLNGEGKVLLKADNNLRNFIFCKGVVYGLDFEIISYGDPAEDIGQLCAYILANRPAFTTSRLSQVASLTRHYFSLDHNLSIPQVEDEIILELERMAVRRKDEVTNLKPFIHSLKGRGILDHARI